MSFCKICSCGEKIVFEKRLSFPDNCPSCGRRLVDFQTYNENDPKVQELLDNARKPHDEEADINAGDSFVAGSAKYALRFLSGTEIPIPDEGGIVGRTGIGAEFLCDYPSVSRQHIKVIPRRNRGVIVQDISTYGTLVDGERIEKNTPKLVAEGSTITLCDLRLTLVVRKECSV